MFHACNFVRFKHGNYPGLCKVSEYFAVRGRDLLFDDVEQAVIQPGGWQVQQRITVVEWNLGEGQAH